MISSFRAVQASSGSVRLSEANMECRLCLIDIRYSRLMRKANRQIRFGLAPKSRHISLLAAGVVLCGWLSLRLL